MDLLQRPQRSGTAQAFGRSALSALLRAAGSTAPPSALPPLRGLSTQASIFSASLTLPTALAATLLRASGAARGVFARPWLPGRSPSADRTPPPPAPAGFGPADARVLWARVAVFSDLVADALRAASVAHLGLVCPRERGELGFRLPSAADPAPLARCLDPMGGRLRSSASAAPSFTLRASGVPIALVGGLSVVLAELDPALTLLSQRVISSSRYTLLVDLVVTGAKPSWESRTLPGVGVEPVVFRLREARPRRQRDPPARIAPTAPTRSLSPAERASYLEVARPAAPRSLSSSAIPPVTPTPAPPHVYGKDDVVPPPRKPAPSSASGSAAASPPAPPRRPSTSVPATAAASKPSRPPASGIRSYLRPGGTPRVPAPTPELSSQALVVVPSPSLPLALTPAGPGGAPDLGAVFATFSAQLQAQMLTLASQLQAQVARQLEESAAAQRRAHLEDMAAAHRQMEASLADIRLEMRAHLSRKRSRRAGTGTASAPTSPHASDSEDSHRGMDEDPQADPAAPSRHALAGRPTPPQ